MIKVVMLFITTFVLVVAGSNEQGGLSGNKMVGVSAKYVDNSDEWEAKEFKHDMFADYMPKVIEEPATVEVAQYTVEEEVYETEEIIIYEEVYEVEETVVYEEEVYVEPVVYEDVVETVEEVYEEPVYSYGATFEATAYAIGGWAVPSTMTAMGTEISNTIYTASGYRIIATDPNTIPMGTVVRVTYSDGTTFLAQADDTGGMIVGNRIDILYDNVPDALTFGRQNVTVEFIN